MPEKTPRFTPIADGCFRDEARMYRDETGAWYQYEYTPTLNVDNRLSFKKAASFAEKCELAGGGWKIAMPFELMALINHEKVDPATDAPGVVSGWHWTGQVDPASPSDVAVVVDLGGGYVYWDLQHGGGLVVACRRVPARQ